MAEPAVVTLDELTRLDDLEQAVRAVAGAYDFSRHAYFTWLRSKAADQARFRRSQVPFRFAVEAFSQALAAVLARAPRLEVRMGLAENVAEEHGHGDPSRSHKHTFEGFLRALGTEADALTAPCPVAVHAFNRGLLDHCLVERHEVGAVLLGIIEYLYVAISHAIAQTIDERRWVSDGAQGHYRLHEALDPVHARDLFALARPAWEARWLRPDLAQALLLGAHHFWRLYDELHRVE